MIVIPWLQEITRRPRQLGRSRLRNTRTGRAEVCVANVERLESRLQLTAFTYAATDVPLPVPPNESGSANTAISRIHVTQNSILQDVNVRLNIEHPWDSDLRVALISPNGSRVELANSVGGSDDNFTETTFDQQAAESIVDAAAPFTGTFRPSGDLSVLNGKLSAGDWQLQVTDTFPPAGSGMLLSWSLILDLGAPLDASKDLAEFNSSIWSTFAAEATASVTDDQSHVVKGEASLKFVTGSGFDTGIELSTSNAPLDLSGFDTLTFFAFADNPNPNFFQGNQPIITLQSATGNVRLEPNDLFLLNHAWQQFRIPLLGDNIWQRTTVDHPDLSAVTRLEIHLDTWDYGFAAYFDGIKFLNQHAVGVDSLPRQVPAVVREPAATGNVVLESAEASGEYSMQVTGTGELTLSLSNKDHQSSSGVVAILDVNHRVLREQAFHNASFDEPIRITEHIGPGHYIVQVRQNDIDNSSRVLMEANFIASSDPRRTIPVGAYPKAMVTARLNDDEFPDVVTVNEFSDDVSVLLSRGDGTFDPELRLAVGAEPVAVVAADVDGDHHVDLIVCNEASNDVSVLLWRNGTFATEQRLTVGQGPVAIQAVDIVNLGGVAGQPLDLVAVNLFSKDASLLIGNGDGTFEPEIRLAASIDRFSRQAFVLDLPAFALNGNDPWDFADLNADDRFEFVIANEFTSDVSVYDGRNGNEQKFRVGAGPRAVRLVDFNDDERLDLVTPNLGAYDFDTGNYSPGTVSVLLGNGDGTFRDQRRFSIGESGIGYRPRSMVVADVNNDGRMDLISPNGRSDDVSVLLGRGDGTFESQQRFGVGGAYPGAVLVRDENSDGRVDIVTQNFASNDSSVLLGRGDGTFEAARRIRTVEINSPRRIVVDVNGDGHEDVVEPDYLANEIDVTLNDVNGHFTNSLSVAPISVGTRPVIVNLNGDRDSLNREIDDVLILTRDGNVLYRQGTRTLTNTSQSSLQTPFGEFGTAVVVNVGRPARDFTVLRTPNGIRIAILDVSGNTVSLFEYQAAKNGQLPSFQQVDSVPITGSLPARIVAANFDRDLAGRDDFAVINQGDQTVTLYLADSQTFQLAQTFLVGAGPVSLTTADLNHDGLTDDLLVPNFGSGDLSVLQNTGAGHFHTSLSRTGPGPYFIGSSPYDASRIESQSFDQTSSAEIGNFNGDDWPDVIATNPGSNSFSILYGSAQGLRSNPDVTLLGGTNARFAAVRVADVNHDGHDDAVFLNELGTQISVYLNTTASQGSQALTLTKTIDLPTPLTGFTLQDANHDGRPDVFATNEFGDLLILLNQGGGQFEEDRRADRKTPLAVQDLNGDGKLDVVLANQGKDSVSIDYEGKKSATKLKELAAGKGDGLAAPGGVKLADLDGDRIADLIVPNTGGNSVLIYKGKRGANGRGNGEFFPGVSIFTGSNPASVTVSDLDGDQRPDLVVTNRGSNTVAVFYGQSAVDGATSIPFRAGALSKLPSGSGPIDAQVVRLTRPDGSMQSGLVVTNSTGNSVSFIPSAGNGIFNQSPSNTVLLGFSPLSGAIVNGNLVLPDPVGNSLGFFPLSAGLFGISQPSISTLVSPSFDRPGAITWGNIDGDELSDLVVINKGNNSVSLFLGDGQGFEFATSRLLDGITHGSEVQVAGSNLYVTDEGREFFTVFDLRNFTASEQVLDVAGLSGGESKSVAGTRLPIYGISGLSLLVAAAFGGMPLDDAETRGDSNQQDVPQNWQSLVSIVNQIGRQIDRLSDAFGFVWVATMQQSLKASIGTRIQFSADGSVPAELIADSLMLLPVTGSLAPWVRTFQILRALGNSPSSTSPPTEGEPREQNVPSIPESSRLFKRPTTEPHRAVATGDEAVEVAARTTCLIELGTDPCVASEILDGRPSSNRGTGLALANPNSSKPALSGLVLLVANSWLPRFATGNRWPRPKTWMAKPKRVC